MSDELTGPAPGDPEEVQRLLFSYRGDLAFDVGGNWGVVASRLAERFTHVVSFEPADESYGILAEAAARRPNLDAVQVAVTDHDGDVLLDVQENSIRTGQLTTSPRGAVPDSLSESTWGRVVDRRSVPGATLNTLAEQHGIPDFIKIDVEGHEDAVICGGLKPDGNGVLEVHTPDLFIEIHNSELGELVEDLLRPIYGEQLHVVRHPHYPPGSWGYDNHYYLIAGARPASPTGTASPKTLTPTKETAMPAPLRDIEADYRNAYIDEYEGYKAAGRDNDAQRVAAILNDRYGHDVDAQDAPEEPAHAPEPGTQETAAAAPPPEAAVEQKPTAKKTAPARKATAKKPPAE